MDQFLEKHYLPQSIPQETNHLNSHLTINEHNTPPMKPPDPDVHKNPTKHLNN